jgi:hypothetical protein
MLFAHLLALLVPPLRRFSSMGATSLMPSARRLSTVAGIHPAGHALTTEDGDGTQADLLGVGCTMRITGWIHALTDLRIISHRCVFHHDLFSVWMDLSSFQKFCVGDSGLQAAPHSGRKVVPTSTA